MLDICGWVCIIQILFAEMVVSVVQNMCVCVFAVKTKGVKK